MTIRLSSQGKKTVIISREGDSTGLEIRTKTLVLALSWPTQLDASTTEVPQALQGVTPDYKAQRH